MGIIMNPDGINHHFKIHSDRANSCLQDKCLSSTNNHEQTSYCE